MTEISKEQARKMQETIDNKRNATLFPGMDLKKEVKVEANQYSDILALLRIRFQEGKAIFLKANIPSSKNSKQIQERYTGKSICCGTEYDRKTKICEKCGKVTGSAKRPMLVNSEVVQRYIEEHADDYNQARPLFLKLIEGQTLPIQLGVYFIRDSHRRWDIGNACQIITDLMKNHFLIPDDDSTNITCVFLGFHVDKTKPGCILKILNSEEFKNKLIELI
jgi:hypothetical protein